MTNEEIVVRLTAHDEQMESNTRRICKLEQGQEEMRALVRSVDKLAESVKTMAAEQGRQGRQLDALESSKNDTFKYWLRTILTAVATGVIGYALASLIQGG